ncbi:DUF4012 domain-containing protein [Micromonospora sp. DT81.3]|uniref:DUF4012 domain-containing protein n=1 Tax=Micromonospora sp. DT81.3 TaxID=3416523 RepID=UPI003CF32A29
MWIALGVVLLALLAWGGWVGVRAIEAKGELDALVPAAVGVQDALKAGDIAEATDMADDFSAHAARASELSGDPLWRAAESLPALGPNLAAVRVASAQLDALSTEALQPVLGASGQLSSLLDSTTGSLDVVAMESLHSPLVRASEALDTAGSELGRLPLASVLTPIRAGVTRMQGHIEEARSITSDLADVTAVLPSMLGADAPRSILMVFQNNAELRTGGGITAAFAEVRADAGALSLVDQGSSREFPELDEPIMPLPQTLTALHGDVAGRWVQNISMSADFTVSADLASEWWNVRTGHRPDTVVSLDPVTLQSALAALGPVDVPGWGQLTADNAVHRLLVEPYMTVDDVAAQDTIFENAAASALAVLLSGSANPVELIASLEQPIEDGRISVWSAYPEEQTVLAAGPLAGQAARQEAAGEDAFAVYLNDTTGAKMDSYLDIAIASTVADCRPDGLRDVTVAVTLTNSAPADAATFLPPSMTGDGTYGVAPGSIGTYVAVSAPRESFPGPVTRDEGSSYSIQADADGRPVSQARLDLAPGQTNTLVFRFVAGSPGSIEPQILHTPTIGQVDVTAPIAGDCPALG